MKDKSEPAALQVATRLVSPMIIHFPVTPYPLSRVFLLGAPSPPLYPKLEGMNHMEVSWVMRLPQNHPGP